MPATQAPAGSPRPAAPAPAQSPGENQAGGQPAGGQAARQPSLLWLHDAVPGPPLSALWAAGQAVAEEGGLGVDEAEVEEWLSRASKAVRLRATAAVL